MKMWNVYTMDFYSIIKRSMKWWHLQRNRWNWRPSYKMKEGRLRHALIVFSHAESEFKHTVMYVWCTGLSSKQNSYHLYELCFPVKDHHSWACWLVTSPYRRRGGRCHGTLTHTSRQSPHQLFAVLPVASVRHFKYKGYQGLEGVPSV